MNKRLGAVLPLLMALNACTSPQPSRPEGGAVDGGADSSVRPEIVTGGTVCDESDVTGLRGTVNLGPGCRFVARQGLRIEGSLQGSGGATIEVPAGAPGVTLAPGASIAGVSIASSGAFGLAVLDADDVTIADVTIESERGVGLFLDGSQNAAISDLTLRGEVDATDVSNPRWARVQGAAVNAAVCEGCECQPGQQDPDEGRVCSTDGRWATWTSVVGLYVVGSTIHAEDLSISGFAGYGMALQNASAEISGGVIERNIGVGIDLRSSVMTLSGTWIRGQSAGPLEGGSPLGIGVLVDAESSLTTSAAEHPASLDDSSILILSDGGVVELNDTALNESDGTGLWARGGRVTIENSEFVNGGAAMVSVDALVNLSNVTVAGITRKGDSTGDGLQIIGPAAGSHLQNVRGTGVVEGAFLVVGVRDPSDPVPTFANVQVGYGQEHGALIGVASLETGLLASINAKSFAGWDTGIERAPTQVESDYSLGADDTYPIVATGLPPGFSSIIGPSYIVGPMF